MQSRLYLKQLLAGVDVATGDETAAGMQNFIYLVGDRQTGEAVAIDAAWDVQGVVDHAAGDDMRLVGALVTHHHRDHVGGHFYGRDVEGLLDLKAAADVAVHVNRNEAEWVTKSCGLEPGEMVTHDSGDVLEVGDIRIEFRHTPGHTPGSQCFLVDDRYLVAGDTLFLNGCGRTDLPGGDPEEMYRTLYERLATVPDRVMVLPGHLYSPAAAATMGSVRERNQVFQPRDAQEWLRYFG